jgi:hypothetical protein
MTVSVDGHMDFTGSASSNVRIGNKLFTTFPEKHNVYVVVT